MAWRVPGFEPMAVLGRGRTGVVVSAHDATTGSAVAIKYLSEGAYRSLESVERFRDEVVELERIEHPNVAQVYQFVEAPAGAAVITQLVDGVTLRRLLEQGPMEPEAALFVLKGALLGLGEAHGRGIVHRDLKPENLIVDVLGVTKVVDIGLATPGRGGATPGDPRYQAPELRAGGRATTTSDVYAAAALFFECVTGRAPKQPGAALLRRSGFDSVLAARSGILPDQIRAFIRLGLAANPAARPADADRLLDQLELVAYSAYGAAWEELGRAKLAVQMAPVLQAGHRTTARRVFAALTPGRALAAVSRLADATGRPRMLVAVGIVILLGGGTLMVSTGALPLSSNPPTAAPSSHVPLAVPGPTVPVPTSSAPTAVKPQQPTGLHVTGRSQTAVSLDWNPTHDNVPVAGYIVTRDGRRVGTTYGPGFTDTGLNPNTRYGFAVTAFDATGNLSPASAAVSASTLREPDTSPPSVPTGLHVTGRSTTSIVLAWSPSHDDVGVAGYDVFRDGTLLTTVTHPGFTNTGLAAATTHTYAVRAFDTANNASALSHPVTAATLVAPDTTKPSVPTSVTATATGTSSINVAWAPSTDNVGVTGYVIFRDGTQIGTATGTSYADFGLTASTTYTYTVRALDAATNQSGPSTPASATTDPAPTPTPTPTPTSTPPPPAVITGVTIDALPVTPFPECRSTIQVTVTISDGGSLPVVLDYTITGPLGGTGSVPVTATNGVPIFLGYGDATAPGTATVHEETSGIDRATGWTPTAECVPTPSTTDPPATDPGPTDT